MKKKAVRRASAAKPVARARQISRTSAGASKKPATKDGAARRTTKVAKPAKRAGARSANVGVVRKGPAAARAPRGASARIPRRAVFIDVENTSSEDDLFEVVNALQLDRATQPIEVMAVGNWRAIGQRLGRRLAGMGAQLVHSAPATGVRDWSDLWIAVAAGCWLGGAQAGDVLEIVSNDRAFDAVGDAAASRGVTYRRLLHKRGAQAAASPAAAEEEPKRRRRSRGGRRRRGRAEGAASAPAQRAAHHAEPAHHAPAKPPATRQAQEIEPHGATRDQMVSLIGRLGGGHPSRWINLDVLEKALKAEGFSRPPGSPRLVTRLRSLKDVEVDAHGRVRLVAAPEPPPPAGAADAEAPAAAAPKKRRRRRKPSSDDSGGGNGDVPTVAAAALAAAPIAEPPAE